MAARDEFTEATKRLIGNRSGWLCSRPNCRASTIGALLGDPDGVLNVGEAAHITAAAPGGKRYDPSLSHEQRRHHSNGIWLCRTCAKAVDNDDKQFPAYTLREWKAAASRRSWQMAVDHVSPFDMNQRVRGAEFDPSGADVDTVAARLFAAARADVEAFMNARKWPSHPIELSLRLTERGDSPPFGAEGLASALARFNEIVMIAQPGTGKSTTIVQATCEMVRLKEVVPIYLPLAEWSKQSVSLWDGALAKRAFRRESATTADLDLLAMNGRLALLLDGWNELDVNSQSRLRTALERAQREFPELRILISSRQQSLRVPMQDPVRVNLEGMSDAQQLSLALGLRGEEGEKLLDQAWRTAGLRELVSVPLYLTALLARVPGDAFPKTKEEVMGLFVREHERTPLNAEALRRELSNLQDVYLIALAETAMVSANTVIIESQARTTISGVESKLREDGQINLQIEPMTVIDVLINHHTLVREGNDGGISFQHQQIQEWYASFEVERLMRASLSGDHLATASLRETVLNDPEWEEAIIFAVERMSRSGEASADTVAATVLLAIEIDPMLAAELVYHCDSAAWTSIAVKVQEYCSEWHRDGEVDRALGFMIRTGRAEFADVIWPLISNPDDQVHLDALRAAPIFRTSVLGVQIDEKVARLPDRVRAHVLSEIAGATDYDGLELVARLARQDPNDDVQFTVIEALAFRRADRFVASLLKVASGEVWEMVARKGYPDTSIYPEIEERLRFERLAILDSETDPIKRLTDIVWNRTASPASARSAKEIIATAEFTTTDPHAIHVIHQAYQKFPDAVSSALVERLMSDKTLPSGSGGYLLHAREQFDDGPLAQAVMRPSPVRYDPLTAARVIGPNTIGALISEAISINAKWKSEPGGFSPADRDRSTLIEDCLAVTRLGPFLQALIQRSPDSSPQAIGKLAYLLARHGENDQDRTKRPPDDLAIAVRDMVKRWAESLLELELFSRSDAASVASAIARLADPALLQALSDLLAADLAGRQLAIRAAQVPGPGQQEAIHNSRTLHTTAYQRAFVEIGGDRAANLLITFLPNLEFGFPAAVALKQIWDRDNGPPENVFANWPDFSAVGARRSERRDRGAPIDDSAFAVAILDTAERLRDSADVQEQSLAMAIARIGFGLPHKDRPGLAATLLSLPGRRNLKWLLLTTFAVDGIVVDADMVMDGIRDYLEEAASRPWMLTDGRWELEGWLELLPFSDRPFATLEAVALLPKVYAGPRQLHRLLKALGNAPVEESEEVLKSLADSDPRFYDEFEWLAAFEQMGTISAVRCILAFVASGKVKLGGQRHSPSGLGRSIGGMMDRHPSIRDDLLRTYVDMPPGTARSIVERAFAEAPNAEIVLALIKVNGGDGRTIEQTELRRTIEHVMTEQHPSTYWKGGFDIVLVPTPDLRKAIFELTDGDDPTARLARECLLEMDTVRDRHDWAEATPRHPDISAGRPWPRPLG